MIVIDTSALCRFLLKEEGWAEIIPCLQPESNTHTIEMLVTETENAIWKTVTKYKILTPEQGKSSSKPSTSWSIRA